MKLPSSRVGTIVRLTWADGVIAVLAPVIARLMRDIDAFSAGDIDNALIYILIMSTTTLIALAHLGIGGILNSHLCTADIRRIGKACVFGILSGLMVIFLFNRLDQIPRSLPLLHLGVLTGLLIGWRIVAAWIAVRWEHKRYSPRHARLPPTETVLLIGANHLTVLLIRMIAAIDGPRPRIVGLLDDNRRLHGRMMAGLRIVAACDQLEQVVGEYATHGVRIDRVVYVPISADAGRSIAAAASPACTELNVDLEIWYNWIRRTSEQAPSEPVQSAVARETLVVHNPGYLRFRRAVDLVGCIAALILLSPVISIVAAIVALDLGVPVIFWQDRVGLRGRRIRVYKFRTLRLPFDRANRPLSDAERLSSVGRLLRATRLDELPQIINILRGDMTLIGPRPLLPVDQPGDDNRRLVVRPGLTGWAQVKGGKLISSEEKNALDLWYVRNCGLMLDIRIVVLTLVAVVRGDVRDVEVLRATQPITP